ncbi:MAG: homoserine kinase [Bacteroidota bacterium]
MSKDSIRLFSPATVANVSCGFDVLGFCLDTIGDEMIVKKTKEKGITITKIEGYDLPFDAEKNVAGVSAMALIEDYQPDCGFAIEIYKKIKPGSGIGSSAASAVGSVFGINELLGNPYDKTQLTQFAIKGEAIASKCEHADNLAPAIFGGFTLVKSCKPLKILELPIPKDLFAVILHPQIEIKTSEARDILPKSFPLRNAITQWANFGSFIHGLHTSDYDLLRESLTDVIIEPHRKQLIPNFDEVQTAALTSGALGCGISGSGPSIYSLCKGLHQAEVIGTRIKEIFENTDIDIELYISKINTNGVKILD